MPWIYCQVLPHVLASNRCKWYNLWFSCCLWLTLCSFLNLRLWPDDDPEMRAETCRQLKWNKSTNNTSCGSYVYWTVHHLDSWIKIDQLDVTCFIISLFNAQHVSNVSTSILRSLRLIFAELLTALSLQSSTTHEITQQISRKLLRMDVLIFETRWALNNGIIKQVTSSWSIFIHY